MERQVRMSKPFSTEGWSLEHYLQAFELNFTSPSQKYLFFTFNDYGDLIISGNTYERRETIKNTSLFFGTNAQWIREVKAWMVFTRGNPKMIRKLLENLNNSTCFYVTKKDFDLKKMNITKPEIPSLNGYSLYPFQKAGIYEIIETYKRGEKAFLLADQMGLGKTIQAIGACKMLGREAVVIAPASMVLEWKYKTKECGIKAEVLSYNKAKEANVKNKILILDEVHYIKNSEAIRTKIVKELVKDAAYVLGLTGTPIRNNLNELANILEHLGIVKSANQFLYEYTARDYEGRFIRVGGEKIDTCTLRMKYALENMFPYLRRNKKDVELEFPEKVRMPIILDAECKQGRMAILEAARKIAEKRNIDLSLLQSEEFIVDLVLEYPFEGIAHARRLYAIEKAHKAAEYIRDILGIEESPIVVFYHHKDVLDVLKGVVPGEHIDGSTTKNKRHELVQEFQLGNLPILYLSLKAASEGITLTAANTAVFAEYDWTPATMKQAEDRINRIGQTSERTFYYYLTSTDSIERLLLQKIIEKEAIIQSVTPDEPL